MHHFHNSYIKLVLYYVRVSKLKVIVMSIIQRVLFEIFRAPLALMWYLMGWRLSIDELEDDKVILTGSPHTSNWDYMHFLLAAITLRRKIYVTIKSELFFFPLGPILKALGGIPIDRHSSHNFVEQLSERLNEADRMVLLFTPDGTRSYRPYWKTGFYWVAQETGIPVTLAIPDYRKKFVYMDYKFHPTGDIEEDFIKVRELQETYGYGLYHEKTNPVITRKAYEEELMDVETDISAIENIDSVAETELTA